MIRNTYVRYTAQKFNRSPIILPLMPVNVDYRMSPLHIWFVFMVYNLCTAVIREFNVYSILHAMFSVDYRILLIVLNVIGWYLFLHYARIDFAIRITMNNNT